MTAAKTKRFKIVIPCRVSCRGEPTADAGLTVEVAAYDRRSAIHAVEGVLQEAAQKNLVQRYSPPDPEQGLHGGGDSD